MLLCVFPVVGKLSDKISREKIVIAASIGFLVLFQPFFYLLSYGNFSELVLIQALIAIPAGAYYTTVPVMLAEMFPINLRCTVLSVLYSIAASLSAGLAPLLSLMLVNNTHRATSPAFLTEGLIVFTIMTMWLIRHRLGNVGSFVVEDATHG